MSQVDTTQLPTGVQRSDWFAWCLLGAILLVVVAVRMRTLDVPLERDEGEYAYIAQLMLQGVPPYAEAYTMKFPGTPTVYAVAFLVFGESTQAVHLALLVANVATILLLFYLVAHWHDRLTAAVAGGCYASWSLMPGLQGTSAHAEHFAVLLGLAGYACLVRIVGDERATPLRHAARLFACGCLLGLAVLMKQQAAFFVAPAMIYLVAAAWHRPALERRGAKNLVGAVPLAAGVIVPFGVLVVTLHSLGVFDKFWFWTVTYAQRYGAGESVHLWSALGNAFEIVGKASIMLDGLLLLGLASLAWDAESRKGFFFWLLMLGAGVAAVLPGLRFYEHYFVFLLPAASFYAAIGVSVLGRMIAKAWRATTSDAWRLALAVIVLSWLGWQNREPWFQSGMVRLSRITYGPNPFPEVVEIARFLKDQASPTDRLLVFGSEPEIYFYTELPAATKYIYTYPLVERQPYAAQMQAEMMDQVERARPEYCVSLNVARSWVPAAGAPDEIFKWWSAYRQENYDLIGVADILDMNRTIYVWGDSAHNYKPTSRVWIGVYRRRDLRP